MAVPLDDLAKKIPVFHFALSFVRSFMVPHIVRIPYVDGRIGHLEHPLLSHKKPNQFGFFFASVPRGIYYY